MKENTKGFIGEFKAFISRGNVVDMAVGIIIGGAFTSIVTSLVNDIFMPALGYVIGGINFKDFKFALPAAAGAEPVYIAYGMFIQNIINFIVIAFVVFCMVKLLNGLRKKEEPAEEKPAEPSEDIVLLTEIRDLLKK